MVADRRFEVRYSRPDEWLRELQTDVADDVVEDGLARIAITHSQATEADLRPWMKGSPDGGRPTLPWFTVRWVQAAYVARGQLVKLSGHCGVICLIADAMSSGLGWKHKSPPAQEERRQVWMKTNRETEDVELALSRQLTESVEALGLKVRTGNMHGFDPNWRAQDVNEIMAPAPQTNCATCSQPIYFSNEQWRHRETTIEPYVTGLADDGFGDLRTHAGRDEAWIERPCRSCNGRTKIPYEKGAGFRRCDDCLLTPGKARKLHHLADPEQRERKI